MKELPQKYDTQETEKRWQQHWLQAGTYHWEEDAPRNETYVIDTPPPTVSGHLHMGHIFSYTQADFVARWQRMNGKTVFYPMGFDDNGLPTERLVEKATKKRAVDFESREAFIEACMGVSDESRQIYRDLFQSVALSVDWNQEYHTISEDSRKISQLSFLDLHQKGHVERRLEPMLWDPIDQTAIAQAEVEDKELPSFANDIPFGIVAAGTKAADIKWNEIEKVTIMTTRPELLAACVALVCHPDDAEKYEGKSAVTPIFGVVVPIIADEKVDKEKGTGLVMCCTFGDETDIHWWKKHNLETRVILNKYGKLALKDKDWLKPEEARAYCSVVDEKWAVLEGLKAAKAREATIEILKELNCLLKQEAITHAVKCAERSGAPLEILPTPQWFVKVMDKKAELKAKSAECNWHPEWMAKRMEQWIDGLSWDWCISRQRYFGVPFPIWYSKRAGEEGKVLIAEPDQLPCNPLTDLPKGYSRDEVDADADVMDTWATSSVSPQLNSKAITSELAVDSERHAKLYPADLRPQAHEIIRTWAFYTLVKSYLHTDGKDAPWKNLMISGWCLAEDKQKMSKSKGNVVTPLALIEEHGADVVRYWASTSKLGQDTAFSRDLLKIGKKLVNKLWNATKFAALHLEKLPPEFIEEQKARAAGRAIHEPAKQQPIANSGEFAGAINQTLDKWILSRLHHAVANATAAFDLYEYAAALRAIEDFFWNDFCDNYLELVKKRAYDEAGEDKAGQMSAVYTIYHCLDGILRLFAPITPHVTEELWSHIFVEKYEATGSIHARGNWPKASDYPLDEAAEKEGIAVVELLEAVRKAKSEKGVSIKWPITEFEITKGLDASAEADLKAAGNIKDIAVIPHEDGYDGYNTGRIEFAEESDAA